MSEHQDARDMLDRAERAATAGDLASADELLTDAARLQEQELGPLHPDLANTLNNRAIVAERAGRFGEAETLYRRSAAIAAAALPSDHPIVVASRQNLEDFCRARGLSIDAPVVAAPAPVTRTGRTHIEKTSKGRPSSPQRRTSRVRLSGPRTPLLRRLCLHRQSRRGAIRPRRRRWLRNRCHLLPLQVDHRTRLHGSRPAWSFSWLSCSSSCDRGRLATRRLQYRRLSPRRRGPPRCRHRQVPVRPPHPRRKSGIHFRGPHLVVTIEKLRPRPPRPVPSRWPPRSYAATSRPLAAGGGAIRWAPLSRQDRSSFTPASDPRGIPPSCIAGIAATRCGGPPGSRLAPTRPRVIAPTAG